MNAAQPIVEPNAAKDLSVHNEQHSAADWQIFFVCHISTPFAHKKSSRPHSQLHRSILVSNPSIRRHLSELPDLKCMRHPPDLVLYG